MYLSWTNILMKNPALENEKSPLYKLEFLLKKVYAATLTLYKEWELSPLCAGTVPDLESGICFYRARRAAQKAAKNSIYFSVCSLPAIKGTGRGTELYCHCTVQKQSGGHS